MFASVISFLSDWVLPISNVATLGASLTLSTKIKDWFAGIPADLRKDLNAIETATLAKVTAARKDVIASVAPAPAPVVKPVVAEVAPAPVVKPAA